MKKFVIILCGVLVVLVVLLFTLFSSNIVKNDFNSLDQRIFIKLDEGYPINHAGNSPINVGFSYSTFNHLGVEYFYTTVNYGDIEWTQNNNYYREFQILVTGRIEDLNNSNASSLESVLSIHVNYENLSLGQYFPSVGEKEIPVYYVGDISLDTDNRIHFNGYFKIPFDLNSIPSIFNYVYEDLKYSNPLDINDYEGLDFFKGLFWDYPKYIFDHVSKPFRAYQLTLGGIFNW